GRATIRAGRHFAGAAANAPRQQALRAPSAGAGAKAGNSEADREEPTPAGGAVVPIGGERSRARARRSGAPASHARRPSWRLRRDRDAGGFRAPASGFAARRQALKLPQG